jgi:hypothetical protein
MAEKSGFFTKPNKAVSPDEDLNQSVQFL